MTCFDTRPFLRQICGEQEPWRNSPFEVWLVLVSFLNIQTKVAQVLTAKMASLFA